MNRYIDNRRRQIYDLVTQKLGEQRQVYDLVTQKLGERRPVYDLVAQKLREQRQVYNLVTCRLGEQTRRIPFKFRLILLSILIVSVLGVVLYPLLTMKPLQVKSHNMVTVVLAPKPFNPDLGTVLPNHRIVAFYAIPGAQATGPAYQLTPTMLNNLQAQEAAYQQIDPSHPVQGGIDLVVSVPDAAPGPDGTYSHHLDPALIQSYIDFCQKNGLILFLDLNFGLAPVMSEVNFFLPYLERYSFVHMAVDPEWMFPRHDGIPGINLSNVRASDLNPIIQALAALPMKYHVPRKILLIHQYRPDGDGLKNPYDPGQAEIADKQHLLSDTRVDVVIHVDGVGGYIGDKADKSYEYNRWVSQDMRTYHNFGYGGFKLFYHIEAKTLMTPQEVLALKPSPMVITYGN